MPIFKLKYLTTSLNFFIKVKLSCNKPILLNHDYSRFDERKFVEDFEKIYLTCLNCSFDAETNYNKFLEDVTISVETHMASMMGGRQRTYFTEMFNFLTCLTMNIASK